MLDNKDFIICIDALEKVETKESKVVLEKLKLLVKANEIKTESEQKLFDIQDKLRKIYDENK